MHIHIRLILAPHKSLIYLANRVINAATDLSPQADQLQSVSPDRRSGTNAFLITPIGSLENVRLQIIQCSPVN